MNALRTVLATLGVGIAVVGVAMIVDPSLASAVPSGDELVRVLGVLAGFQGGRILWHRYRSDLESGSVEENPESTPAGPPPGESFDELATAAGDVTSGRTLRSRRDRLRRRLRRVIVATLQRREDLDAEDARETVETGTWTDDPTAAAFFTDGATTDDSSSLLSLSQGGPGEVTHRANRAAIAVAELVGVETGEFGSTAGRTVGTADAAPADATDDARDETADGNGPITDGDRASTGGAR